VYLLLLSSTLGIHSLTADNVIYTLDCPRKEERKKKKRLWVNTFIIPLCGLLFYQREKSTKL